MKLTDLNFLEAQMSKTPRTDAQLKLEAFFDGIGIVETVEVEFAQQLETELAESRAEIENLKWHVSEEQAKTRAALELNDRALELVNEARAGIERLKSEHEDSLRRAKNNAVSLSGAVTEYAGELLAKGKLIEQMLEALEAVVRVADRATVDFDMARAAIRAAKGEV